MLRNQIILSLFIPENLTYELYSEMLENLIDPLVTEIIENYRIYYVPNLHSQQDGTSPPDVATVNIA